MKTTDLRRASGVPPDSRRAEIGAVDCDESAARAFVYTADMVKAEYDSESDTIQIELERGCEPVRRKAIAGGAVVLSVIPEYLATIDVIDAARGAFEDALRAAAGRHGLDVEELIAAARASVAIPDRPIELELGPRIAA